MKVGRHAEQTRARRDRRTSQKAKTAQIRGFWVGDVALDFRHFCHGALSGALSEVQTKNTLSQKALKQRVYAVCAAKYRANGA